MLGARRHHPFLDSDNRIAFLSVQAFAGLNGAELFRTTMPVRSSRPSQVARWTRTSSPAWRVPGGGALTDRLAQARRATSVTSVGDGHRQHRLTCSPDDVVIALAEFAKHDDELVITRPWVRVLNGCGWTVSLGETDHPEAIYRAPHGHFAFNHY